jgi:hypothetical protein
VTWDPFDEVRLFVQSRDFQGSQAVSVPGQQVGSVFGENRQRLRARIPFSREMDGGSAAGTAGMNIRPVRDQPGDRPVIGLMGERL